MDPPLYALINPVVSSGRSGSSVELRDGSDISML